MGNNSNPVDGTSSPPPIPSNSNSGRPTYKSTLNDRIASWILFVVIVGLVVSLCFVVVHTYSSKPDVRKVEICYVPADSSLISQGNKDARLILPKESLDSIIASIQAHEDQLEHKYQFVIDKRDEEDNYRNIFMLVFGIVVSVVGFFGYRSFNDIEERAMNVAADKADVVAKDVAGRVADVKSNEVATGYCDQNVGPKVESYLRDNLQSAVDKKVDELYNGSGKEAIVKQLEGSLDTKISVFLSSEAGKSLIKEQLENYMAETQSEDNPDGIPEEVVSEAPGSLQGEDDNQNIRF